MDVWFYLTMGTAAERHERELKDPKNLFHALLPSASGELLPS
jgi:hypothetical protein